MRTDRTAPVPHLRTAGAVQGAYASVVDHSVDDMRATFEVNFYGVVNMVQVGAVRGCRSRSIRSFFSCCSPAVSFVKRSAPACTPADCRGKSGSNNLLALVPL